MEVLELPSLHFIRWYGRFNRSKQIRGLSKCYTLTAGQGFGVNLLFLALLIVVVGSLTGEWLSIQNKLTDLVSFYFGH